MKLLLDTHTFLWLAMQPEKLSATARRRITNPRAKSHLSLASIWEAAIKLGLGKLRLEVSLAELVETCATQNHVELLPIARRHVLSVAALPLHHRDPFDRLLICQALAEDMFVVSIDEAFDGYGVRRIW